MVTYLRRSVAYFIIDGNIGKVQIPVAKLWQHKIISSKDYCMVR
jgi:hypothetical protein